MCFLKEIKLVLAFGAGRFYFTEHAPLTGCSRVPVLKLWCCHSSDGADGGWHTERFLAPCGLSVSCTET